MKTKYKVLATAIVIGVLVTGFWYLQEMDNVESFTNKAEWGVLQGIELKHRGMPIKEIEYVTVDSHRLVCLPTTGGGRVWIMMAPAGSTRYKQMGSDENFTITKQQLEQIVARGKPTATVGNALAAHLGNQ